MAACWLSSGLHGCMLHAFDRPVTSLCSSPFCAGSDAGFLLTLARVHQDFIKWDNSELLKCDGRAFLLDYSQARPVLVLAAAVHVGAVHKPSGAQLTNL